MYMYIIQCTQSLTR